MLPDIVGLTVERGIEVLREWGFGGEGISIEEYMTPKKDIIGNEKRILRVNKNIETIKIIIGNF